ncbi:short-chain fatty acyl-CoA regulator family protein [Citreimonas sp.]|uniref:short-chain fatty acyl-CoA regulator family protein n=1 Tax=Citreimonas sp. TaxID=3036715 RepID=UPI0035C872DE
MARGTLIGSRIRERRIAQGMRQADLARAAGISASYLNLIEHNRRRIGGKLLVDIAALLDTEAALLAEGAGAALIAGLREAAGAAPDAGAEIDRVDEFTGRFPGWARLLAETRARVTALERTVETLTDRMTHDPHLATSLHEMLTTVTAIRSTAAILAEPGEIAPEWQARFHRNINEDSARLAETSRALVAYLESDGEAVSETGSPQEEVQAAWDAVGHHVPALEEGAEPAEALAEMGADLSAGARSVLHVELARYAADAAALPMDRLAAYVDRLGPDPVLLADDLGADVAVVMRRLAAMPSDRLAEPVGLVTCDASGVLGYRKPLPAFPMPRVGAGCPLWPLYRALARPFVVVSDLVRPAAGDGTLFCAEALALPIATPLRDRDPVLQAQMLIRPGSLQTGAAAAVEDVGSACRVCPREACRARREPSILAGAARGAPVF